VHCVPGRGSKCIHVKILIRPGGSSASGADRMAIDRVAAPPTSRQPGGLDRMNCFSSSIRKRQTIAHIVTSACCARDCMFYRQNLARLCVSLSREEARQSALCRPRSLRPYVTTYQSSLCGCRATQLSWPWPGPQSPAEHHPKLGLSFPG
jgi:hypothetical protein